MRHGALFNGIGGFQLAASWLGWENVFHCEIDKFCNKVVKQHFPNSICYEDIKQFDARQWNGKIDIISGGFPCQPFSQAGKRKGTEDNRYLWPEMLRIIREVSPRYIVGENVSGLINWDRGLVFEQVQADLEAAGYESQAHVLPACAKNAPHRRDRVWFIANASGFQWTSPREKGQQCRTGGQSFSGFDRITSQGIITDSYKERLSAQEQIGELGWRGFSFDTSRNTWEKFPSQSPVCRGDDGIPNRVDRIKALGNAIVPQVAYEIFKAIETAEQQIN